MSEIADHSIDWNAKVTGITGEAAVGTFVVAGAASYVAATTANYAAAPTVHGVVIRIPLPSATGTSRAATQFNGPVARSVTGFTTSQTGKARLNLTTGRAEFVANYVAGDIELGSVSFGVLFLGGGGAGSNDAQYDILPAYFVDGQNISGLASDLNTGESRTTPLLTGAEWARRITSGGRQAIDKNVDLTWMSRHQAEDDASFDVNLGPWRLRILGDRVQVATAVVTAVSGVLPNDPMWIEVTAFDWSTYVHGDYQVVNTTKGRTFTLHRNLGAGRVEVSKAASSLPYPADLYDFFGSTVDGSVDIGDSLVIYQLPRMATLRMAVDQLQQCLVQRVAIDNPGLNFNEIAVGNVTFCEAGVVGKVQFTNMIPATQHSWSLFFNCNIDSSTDYTLGQRLQMTACSWRGADISIARLGFFDGGTVLRGFYATHGIAGYGGAITLSDVVLMGVVDTERGVNDLSYQAGAPSWIALQNFVAGAFTNATIRGTGTIKVSPGSKLLYYGTATANIVGAVTLDTDNGENQGYASYDDGSRTPLRSITWANLSATVAGGGLNNAVITKRGSVIASGTLSTANAGTGYPAGGTLAGDATGALGANVVERINGATVPVSGALTTGNVLQVSGLSALSYGPVNLAGGANFVTGTLPVANLPSLAGDVTGPIGTSVVEKLSGVAGVVGGTATALSLGATPSTVGSFRLPSGGSIYTRDAANSADLLLISDAGNGIEFGRYAGNINTYAATYQFWFFANNAAAGMRSTHIAGTTGPSLRGVEGVPFQIAIDSRTSDNACSDLTVQAQAPFATATAGNRSPGNIQYVVPSAITGGAEGYHRFSVAGAEQARVGSGFISVGATVPVTGTLRLGVDGTVYSRNSGNDYRLIGLSGTVVEFSSYATQAQFRTNSSFSYNSNSGFVANFLAETRSAVLSNVFCGVSRPTYFTILTPTSDTACEPVYLHGTIPFATATGTNRNSGNVILAIAAPVSGGTAGVVRSTYNGTAITESQSDAFALKQGLRRNVRVVAASDDIDPVDDTIIVSGHGANVTLQVDPAIVGYQVDGTEFTVFNDSLDKTVTLNSAGGKDIVRSGGSSSTCDVPFRGAVRVVYSNSLAKFYVVGAQP